MPSRITINTLPIVAGFSVSKSMKHKMHFQEAGMISLKNDGIISLSTPEEAINRTAIETNNSWLAEKIRSMVMR